MNLNDRLTRLEVVQLIAPRDIRNGEDAKHAENRVSKRLGYAITKGKIQQEEDGSFILANLIFWIARNWPDKFNDLPVVGYSHMTMPMPIVTMSGFTSDSMPNSVEKCHSLLEALYQRIATLEKENSELKPNADNYKAICKSNRASAKMKRGK